MMDYSPINYRRLDWFRYNIHVGAWRDLHLKGDINKNQSALCVGSYRGYLK